MAPRTYTMEEVARHDGRDGTYWTVVDGEVYDLGEFMPKHPGRGLLKLAAGRQATPLFESYHPGPSLERARRVLGRRTRHVGSLDPAEVLSRGNPTFFDDVQQRVAERLRERGLDYRSGGWIMATEAVIVASIYAVAWYFRAFDGSYLAAIVGGVMMARMGFLMHSGNHAAVARRSIRNRLCGLLMEYIGGSSIIWRHAHQFAHHGHPNIYGYDNDCEIGTPLLRFHPEIPHRPWHRIQHIGLAIGMSVGMVKWLVSDVTHLLRGRVVNASFHLERRTLTLAMLHKVAWGSVHLVLPMVVLGPLHGVLTTLVMLGIGSYYMEGIFIVNHLQKDLVPPNDRHWAEQQVMGTTNWGSASRWSNFISGGLNHQIEHHLFPSMAVHLYPVIAPVVREACEDHGIPYRSFRGFWPALWGTIGFLHALGWPKAAGVDRTVPREGSSLSAE
ncbi:MAG: fatty acid desaturase [Myxococcales bacterium]|nr:fatty acid desaturase [Myxococcales bacterium]